MLTDLKPLLSSRTIWANLVGFLAVGLAAAGVPKEALGNQPALVDAILQVVAGGSFVASTVFRVIATQRLR